MFGRVGISRALLLVLGICGGVWRCSAEFQFEWHPGTFTAWSRDKGHQLVTRGDGAVEIRHHGAGDWVLNGFERIRVNPGEAFTFSCHSELASDEVVPKPFRLEAVLFDERGRVLAYDWGRRSARPGENAATTFLVPNRVAYLQPRISGVGDFGAAFPIVRFHRAEIMASVTPEENLPPEVKMASEALEVAFATSNGVFSVVDRRTGRRWASRPAVRSIVIQSAVRKTMFAIRFVDGESLLRYTVVCRFDGPPDEFLVSIAAEKGSVLGDEALVFPPPFTSEKGDRLILPKGMGVGVPVTEEPPLADGTFFSGRGFSMAFFGVVSADEETGWTAIVETPDDACVVPLKTGADRYWTLAPGWFGQKGAFGYERRVRYVFFEKGGYVAQAKRYQRHVRERGGLRTLQEKAAARPLLARLPGTLSVWYQAQRGEMGPVSLAEELRQAGISRILWSAPTVPAVVRNLAARDDVLVGRTDAYQAVFRPEQIRQLGWTHGPNESHWPAHVVWEKEHPNSWRPTRKVTTKTGKATFCATLCDHCVGDALRQTLTSELQVRAYSARRLGSPESAGWLVCANPAHPTTRRESRTAREAMMRAVGDEFHLVVGSGEGLDALAGVCDYVEEAWPQKVGPARRLPLWQLVYHAACTVLGDLGSLAEDTPDVRRQTEQLFCALYGQGASIHLDAASWKARRDELVAGHRIWGPIARRTGFAEMVSHAALSPDRLVQRSVFSDGTTVVVNFGTKPYALDGAELAPGAVAVRP